MTDDILMRFPFQNAIYRLMRLCQMPDALALGWIPLRPHDPGGHNADDYAVLCAWICCDCRMNLETGERKMRLPL
jgi:hypothetical protein